jgi:hypothetical protein
VRFSKIWTNKKVILQNERTAAVIITRFYVTDHGRQTPQRRNLLCVTVSSLQRPKLSLWPWSIVRREGNVQCPDYQTLLSWSISDVRGRKQNRRHAKSLHNSSLNSQGGFLVRRRRSKLKPSMSVVPQTSHTIYHSHELRKVKPAGNINNSFTRPPTCLSVHDQSKRTMMMMVVQTYGTNEIGWLVLASSAEVTCKATRNNMTFTFREPNPSPALELLTI